jgi:L-aminopeptidase/D-esterase-like protein
MSGAQPPRLPVGGGPALPRPGTTDSLVDVPGVRVGQVELGAGAEAPQGVTGVTAVVVPAGAMAAVDVRGGAPGTRETDALGPLASGERCHAVLLVGRSVFGLAAADGATTELAERGIGLALGPPEARVVIPIVAAAVVFDLFTGDPAVRPDPETGRRAVAAALDGPVGRPRRGRAGAGTGTRTGGLLGLSGPGGIGHASLVVPWGRRRLVVGALAVVNAAGTVLDPASGRPWAEVGSFHRPAPLPDFSPLVAARGQTSLVVVATNAVLTRPELGRVAAMAHDGLARAIRPAHTAVDGDVVFALSVTGTGRPLRLGLWSAAAASTVGALAADAVCRAVLDAVR